MADADYARREALEEAARECDAAARRVNALMLDSGSPARSVVLAGTVAVCQEVASSIRALGVGGHPEMKPEERYLATVAELQALAKNAPHVTQADILEIASMPADELRRRAIRSRDWWGHWAHCLDGLEVWKMPGAAPDGCWMPREVRSVVEQLLRRNGGVSEAGSQVNPAHTPMDSEATK